MSYEPTNWKSGDTVTSAKLNKMEQGIANAGSGGGALVVHDNNGTLDKTWQEIYDATPSVTIIMNESGVLTIMPLFGMVEQDGAFALICGFIDPSGSNGRLYYATSADGYPVFQHG